MSTKQKVIGTKRIAATLKGWLDAKEEGAKTAASVGIVTEADLIKVGGLYRIRDNYEAVWRMEGGEDGKRYIVRADEAGGGATERLLVTSELTSPDSAKAAGTVTAGKCESCGGGDKSCKKCHGKPITPWKGSWADEEEQKRKEKSAFKIVRAGAVYVAWECEGCATPNLTKFGNQYECDECHKRYADVLRTEDQMRQDKQTYTRAEVAEHSPEFAQRMAREGIRVAHKNLLQVWEKEAEKGSCLGCGYARGHAKNCNLKGVHQKAAGHNGKTIMECASDGCTQCREDVKDAHSLTKPSHEKKKLHEKDAASEKCKKCRVPDHDTCGNSADCPCCADSRREGAKAVNPWAVCHESVGPEKSEKFERCVKDVKKKSPVKKD